MEPFYQSKGFYGTQQAFRFEADVHDCEVVGQVAPGLNGSLYRAGPDRQYPTLDDDVIINGDGMVSEFRFENGHVGFRCRYAQTAGMRHPGGAGWGAEPVFVPRSPDAPEGDGWLLFLVNHNAANLAELRVVDALDITGPPVAVARLPFNQPTAFHGCFVPR